MKEVGGFIKLSRALVQREVWRALSPAARAIMLDLWAWHNGSNNGSIRYSVSQAMEAGHCSRSTAIRRLKDLEDVNLIEATERGGFRWKTGAREGRSTSWRIVPEAGGRKAKLSEEAPSKVE